MSQFTFDRRTFLKATAPSLVATGSTGRYQLPREADVQHVDGTSCGFPEPARRYSECLDRAAE
jgi:hypothetical protein